MADRNDNRIAVTAAVRRVAAETGVCAAVLLAVAIVETAAVPHAVFGGRREPLIRFEGHCFDRLLSPVLRIKARAAGLSHPKAGAIANPKAQEARWRLLDRAAAIDAGAAYAATSWGLGQVMGLHWKALGFTGPEALAAEARGSTEGQVRLAARFLRIGDLHRRLERGDIAGFARLYNGPAYRRNGYDAKIARAYAQAARWLAEDAASGGRSSAPSLVVPSGQSAGVAPDAASGVSTDRAKGWSRRGRRLSAVASWFIHRFSTRPPTPSFSTSTEPSSASRTIRPPFASNLRCWIC